MAHEMTLPGRRRARLAELRGRGRPLSRLLARCANNVENGSGANGNKVAEGVAEAVGKSAGSKSLRNGSGASAGPFKGWWKAVDKPWKNVVAATKEKAAALKTPAMEMKVNVDVLKPTFDSVKGAATEAWAMVPPPVRRASPYVAAAAGAAVVVHAAHRAHFRRFERRMQQQLDALKADKAALEEEADPWRMRGAAAAVAGVGAADTHAAMSRAVAEATQAAAAAALSAAEAAKVCALPRHR